MMPRRNNLRPSTTRGALLLPALFAFGLLLAVTVPAEAGKAQQRTRAAGPGTLATTNSPGGAMQCQAGWKVVPVPGGRVFSDVAAISPDDVWVVGDNGAVHWDGASWSQIPAEGVTNLTDISAVSHDDVWATDGARVVHWDGTSWSLAFDPPVGPGNGGAYSDLAAISSDDVWVVGAQWPTVFRPATYAIHWNGEEWTVADSPQEGSSGSQMLSVSGVPGGHVWAVGRYEGPALFYWTGENWTSTYPESGSGWPYELSAIEVVASNDVWAGGYFSNGSTNIQHYDGAMWTYVSSPDIGNVNAMSAAAPDDVWAVGKRGTLHWDGSTWSQVPAPDEALTAVDAEGPEDAWAVGIDVVMHYSSDPFWDVPQSSPFYSYVRCLACQGIVTGHSDASFRPNEPVTRGQAAKIVANAAGYNDDIPPTRQTFMDVPTDSPFWVYIERVYAHGAISGYSCGAEDEPCPGVYYRPGAYLTRGQLAKIASNVASYDETPGGQTFKDVPPGSPFYTFIERAAAHNVITGYPCGGTNPATGEAEPCPGTYFRPGSNVTRGQAAKIVVNALLPGCEVPARPQPPSK